jgi:hypothetical protein
MTRRWSICSPTHNAAEDTLTQESPVARRSTPMGEPASYEGAIEVPHTDEDGSTYRANTREDARVQQAPVLLGSI